MMSEFLLFVRSISKHTVLLVTGGTVAALIALWEHHQSKSVSRHVYWIIVAVFVLIAAYRTWVQEYRGRIQSEARFAIPTLSGDVLEAHVGAGPLNSDVMNLFLHLRLKNESDLPIQIRSFRLRARIGNNFVDCGYNHTLDNWQLRVSKNEQWGYRDFERMRYVPLVDLADSTNRAPVELVRETEGWVRFVVPSELVHESAEINAIMTITDSTGKEHEINHCIRGDTLQHSICPKLSPIIIVSKIARTCRACPSQYQGVTDTGAFVYVRYRSGWLNISVGQEESETVSNEGNVFRKQPGDTHDGELDYEKLRDITGGLIAWPEVCVDTENGPGWRKL